MSFDRHLFDYLPGMYRELRESNEIIESEQTEIERLNAEIQDVLAQFFVDTATWGLAYWERVVGVETDESKPIEERRSVIKAKLRGAGVATVVHIKEVAESWYGGEVEVTEHYADYKITVKFVSSYGVPSNIGDVERALREIIPAHLAIDFEFMYVLYSELIEKYGTYDGMAAAGLTYNELLVT